MFTNSTKAIQNNQKIDTPEEVGQYFPDFLDFIDCTEQPIPRPENKIRRKLYYSGKKKRHTVKNLYMANKHGLLLYKTKYKQVGKRRDYNLREKSPYYSKRDGEYSGYRLLRSRKRLCGTNIIIIHQEEEKKSRVNFKGKRVQQNSF